ncbi:MAG TPA: hypothetical protein VMM36_04685 [Opitutaceae bacterium]|nr:hypothetical protein [Opitutaceae bacterium]
MSDVLQRSAGNSRRKTALRWALAGVAGALVPKCVLCIAGYAALLTGASVVGPELCGAVAGDGAIASWILMPAGMAAAWLAYAAFRFWPWKNSGQG